MTEEVAVNSPEFLRLYARCWRRNAKYSPLYPGRLMRARKELRRAARRYDRALRRRLVGHRLAVIRDAFDRAIRRHAKESWRVESRDEVK
jgi:hypothetical protein